jgi:hypothetical protein
VRHVLIALCAVIAAASAAPTFASENPVRATRLDPYKTIRFDSCQKAHGRSSHGRCTTHRPRAVGQRCVRSNGGKHPGVAGDPCH